MQVRVYIYTLAVTSFQIHIHLSLWHTLQSTHTCIYCTLYPNWHCRGITIKDSVWCHSLIEYSKESIISFGMGAADYGGRAKLDDPLRGGEPNLTTREGERDKFSRRPVRGETFWTFLREGSEFMNRGPRAEVGGRENFWRVLGGAKKFRWVLGGGKKIILQLEDNKQLKRWW